MNPLAGLVNYTATHWSLLAVLALGLSGVWSPAAELKVGAARVQITPPPGVPLAGYYHERGADGVHDDLFSRAIVLERDGVKAALVSLDLISTRRKFVEQARALIEQQTGIPGAHVMISATHAHTGPILPDTSARDAGVGEGGAVAKSYLEALPGLIAQSVRLAHGQLQPAAASSFIGHEPSLTFNRRFHMKDGSVGWNPGKLNPDIIQPAGPIDPAVPVVFFETPRQQPIATYVNYAVHLDNVGGRQISADFPHTLTESLAKVLGPDHVTLWTAGTCGDLNHINVNWARPQKGQETAARMGFVLAGEVLRNWPNLQPAGDGPLRIRSTMVSLPLAPIDDAEVVAAGLTVRTVRDSDPGGFMKLVKAYQVLDIYARQGKPLEVEVQAITLGDDLAWVSLPGEVFVQLGLDLKLDSPFKQTMIAELANGSIGYIPNRRAYPQGNYEVISARCAEGSGEMLVQAAVAMLKEIRISNQTPTEEPKVN
jgi:neutral ceramidase